MISWRVSALSGAKCGFEAKVVSQAQTVLATRKNTNEFNSNTVHQKLSIYMTHKRKTPR
jgi:hypothetical protein